jgi:hypothetical protein
MGKGLGTGTVAGSVAASAPAIGSGIVGGATGLAQSAASEGLMKGLGSSLLKTGTGFDTEAPMKENVSNMAVKQMEGAMNQKEQPAPVTYDNSIAMQSPKTVDAGAAQKIGGQESLPPEVMMQLIKMMQRQKAQSGGTSRPLAGADQFPGGYY